MTIFSEKLSPGPYKLVGMRLITLCPYCKFIERPISIPAIFAMAYGEFVGSSLPVKKLSSLIGFSASRGYIQLLPKLII